jgi:pyrroline-5-carboxylate reductase
MISIGFIGGGRVTKILLKGLEICGQLPSSVKVYDNNQKVVENLKNEFHNINISNEINNVCSQDIIFLALHPPIIMDILEEIKANINPDSHIVSLAPKITIKQISERLGGFQNIIRMIPNAPSIINEGYNPLVFPDSINPDKKIELQNLFNCWGDCPEVDEDKLEAYAVLTAMGPTYFWFQIKKLHDLGLSFGLEDMELRDGLNKMISGTAHTFYQSGLNSEEVMDLIPVKPLKDEEESIETSYQSRLTSLFQQLNG